jgi:hypothetical protein
MGNTCTDCPQRGHITSEGAISFTKSEAEYMDPKVNIRKISMESPKRQYTNHKFSEDSCLTPGLASNGKDQNWSGKKFIKLKKILDKKFTRCASTPNLSNHSNYFKEQSKGDSPQTNLDES